MTEVIGVFDARGALGHSVLSSGLASGLGQRPVRADPQHLQQFAKGHEGGDAWLWGMCLEHSWREAHMLWCFQCGSSFRFLGVMAFFVCQCRACFFFVLR